MTSLMRPVDSYARYSAVMINRTVKKLRARAIMQYLRESGINRVVCYSSGNAASALRAVMLMHSANYTFVEVGTSSTASLLPTGYHSPSYIARVFAGYFDATSGHLPVPLMIGLADEVRTLCNNDNFVVANNPNFCHLVPFGSGETYTLLTLAFPLANFIGVSDIPGHLDSHATDATFAPEFLRLRAGVVRWHELAQLSVPKHVLDGLLK